MSGGNPLSPVAMETATQTGGSIEASEWLKCHASAWYFIDTYVQIMDSVSKSWIPFKLWPAQVQVLDAFASEKLVIALKARQLGLTWLALAWELHGALFQPIQDVLIFSKRETEAVHLLDERMKGMYQRLPPFLQAKSVETDAKTLWSLSNGSAIRAFPTTGGDTYSATRAMVDEADLVPDLDELLSRVKPTIDAGGQLILISRSDKDAPASAFKAIYKAAREGTNGWRPIFLPWNARPDRDLEWYRTQATEILTRTGSKDRLLEQYPTSDTDALEPNETSKRIPAEWLRRGVEEMNPLPESELGEDAPAIAGLVVYKIPESGHEYIIVGDPAEGKTRSDDSALMVFDREDGEEVAAFWGKVEPGTFAAYIDEIGTWYNEADVLPERNNHGHAVLLWLNDHSGLALLNGLDGHEGWLSNSKGKAYMWSKTAEAFRDRKVLIHTFKAIAQVASIEDGTLSAPEGEADDLAMTVALGVVGMEQGSMNWSLGSGR